MLFKYHLHKKSKIFKFGKSEMTFLMYIGHVLVLGAGVSDEHEVGKIWCQMEQLPGISFLDIC